MSSREQTSSALIRLGRSVLILRDPGNISEKHLVTHAFGSRDLKTNLETESSLWAWNSDLVSGDICQDSSTQERKIITGLNAVGANGQRDAYRASAFKVNDTLIIYELVESSALDEYGKKTYADTVRVNDYCSVFHNVRGDSLEPIGQVMKSVVMIVFSDRKLDGVYIPEQGNRIVLLDGSKYQIDALDSHIYPGCWRVLCSPDQRAE